MGIIKDILRVSGQAIFWLTLGLTLGFLLFVLGDPQYESIEKWQTLLAGLIATLAAVLTILQMKREHKATTLKMQSERYREGLSVRAEMPAALVVLEKYAESCVFSLIDAKKKRNIVPSIELEKLIMAIRYVDDSSAKKLHNYIAFFQIHLSRLEGDWSQREFDSVKLLLLTRSIYDYARLREEQLTWHNFSQTSVLKYLSNLDFDRIADKNSDFSQQVRKYISLADGEC